MADWPESLRLPIRTTLPTSPVDGQFAIYQNAAMATAKIEWMFRYDYNGGSPDTYPWRFVGGSKLRDTNAGTPSTFTSTTFINLSITGPDLTAPLAGVYDVEWWSQMQNDTVGAVCFYGVKNGAGALVDGECVRGQTPVANHDMKAPTGSREITVAAASTVLTVQYRNSAGTTTVNNHGGVGPWLTIIPLRVA